jgi:hypothetical protein
VELQVEKAAQETKVLGLPHSITSVMTDIFPKEEPVSAHVLQFANVFAMLGVLTAERRDVQDLDERQNDWSSEVVLQTRKESIVSFLVGSRNI